VAVPLIFAAAGRGEQRRRGGRNNPLWIFPENRGPEISRYRR